jgi:hypothetical protein
VTEVIARSEYRRPGQERVERLVVSMEPDAAARLRLQALRAWEHVPRQLSRRPIDEQREEFIQRHIGARIERMFRGVMLV